MSKKKSCKIDRIVGQMHAMSSFGLSFCDCMHAYPLPIHCARNPPDHPGCPWEFDNRFMYIAPSNGHSLLNINVPFKVILWRFEVVFYYLEWESCTFLKDWWKFIHIHQYYNLANLILGKSENLFHRNSSIWSWLWEASHRAGMVCSDSLLFFFK